MLSSQLAELLSGQYLPISKSAPCMVQNRNEENLYKFSYEVSHISMGGSLATMLVSAANRDSTSFRLTVTAL